MQCKECDNHTIIQNCACRTIASRIIDEVIEPDLNTPLNGEFYYEIEDKLTYIIAEGLEAPKPDQYVIHESDIKRDENGDEKEQ